MINSKLKRTIYESKKARDILDEEFVEFGPIKRSINEFFNIYNTKFYNILKIVHKFFAEQSLQYVIDYINPKKLTEMGLQEEIEKTQIEIDSIEKFHPIFQNNTVLNMYGTENYYYIQSGKRRKIIGEELIQKVKDSLRKTNKSKKNWSINVPSATINGIPRGPRIEKEEDINISTYTTNTGKELPFNTYTG
tara:strand:+ start:4821 stop:5396 length:576 start_codon:yes stop_codon:yes gene_type:complete